MGSHKVSKAGITSNTPLDAEYNLAESPISSGTTQRDSIASAIKQQLEGARVRWQFDQRNASTRAYPAR
jgi:hypothetical protein